MTSFAQFGNDLFTGKRSIDFVGLRRRWYALSAIGLLPRRPSVSACAPPQPRSGVHRRLGFRFDDPGAGQLRAGRERHAQQGRARPRGRRHQARATPSACRPRSSTTPVSNDVRDALGNRLQHPQEKVMLNHRTVLGTNRSANRR